MIKFYQIFRIIGNINLNKINSYIINLYKINNAKIHYNINKK